MTLEELKSAILESVINNELSEDTATSMITIMQEGVFSNPIRKKLDKLKEIKKAKPNEYDGPAEVKKFVDKYYDDIVKAARILEKEPDDLRKNEVRMYLSNIGILVSGFTALAASMALDSTIFAIGGVGILVLSVILSIIYRILSYVRKTNDTKAIDDLSKVRTSLKKIDTKKLPKEYKNKVSDIVTFIDDAETEINARIKVAKESVDVKLRIYEAYESGDISSIERDILLEKVNARA